MKAVFVFALAGLAVAQNGPVCLTTQDKVTGNQCQKVIQGLNDRKGSNLQLNVENGCDTSNCADDCVITVCSYDASDKMDLPVDALIGDVNSIIKECGGNGDEEFAGRFQALDQDPKRTVFLDRLEGCVDK